MSYITLRAGEQPKVAWRVGDLSLGPVADISPTGCITFFRPFWFLRHPVVLFYLLREARKLRRGK